MWEYNGRQFTQEEVEKAAQIANLSFDEYVQKRGITKVLTEEKKEPMPDGKLDLPKINQVDPELGFYARGAANLGYELSPTTGKRIYSDPEKQKKYDQELNIEAKDRKSKAEMRAVANRTFALARTANKELFTEPGVEALDTYYGPTLDFKKKEDVETFVSKANETFLRKDEKINELYNSIYKENEKEIVARTQQLIQKYNLDNINRDDYNEDAQQANEELGDFVNTLVFSDIRVLDRVKGFHEQMQVILADQEKQQGAARDMLGLDSPNEILGINIGAFDTDNIFSYHMFGGGKRIKSRMIDFNAKFKSNKIYNPLIANADKINKKYESGEINDDSTVYINDRGHIVSTNEEGERVMDTEDVRQQGAYGYNKKMTYGEAKKVQLEQLKENKVESNMDALQILDRIATDSNFEAAKFSKVFEEGGGWKEVYKLLGDQVPEMAFAIATLGVGTAVSGGGDMYIDRVLEKVKEKNNLDDAYINNPENREEVARLMSDYNETDEAKEDVKTANMLAVPYGAAELIGMIPQFKAGAALVKNLGSSIIRGQFKKVLPVLGQGGVDSFKAGLAESITETFQTGFEDVSRFAIGETLNERMKNLGQNLKSENYIEAAGAGGLIGALLPFSAGIAKQTVNEVKAFTKIAIGKLDSKSMEAFYNSQFKALDQALENGDIEQDEYLEKKEAIAQIREADFSMPKNIADKREQALELLLEKIDNSKQIEKAGKDGKALVQDLLDRNIEIDLELAKIAALSKVRDVTAKAGKAISGLDLDREIEYIVAKDAKEAQEKAGKKSIALDADATGYISADGRTIIIDEQKAAELGEVFTAQHEVLHAALFNTLYNLKDGEITGKNVVRGLAEALKSKLDKLDTSKPTNNQGKRDFYRRLALYQGDPNATRAEEVLTLFSDAIAYGDIKFEEGAFTKIKDAVRRLLQDIGFGKIEFNTEEDVYNFIKDYNKSIAKGRFTRAQRTAIKEGVNVGKGIRRFQGKENVAQPKTDKKSRALINSTYDKNTTKDQWKNGGAADAAISKLFTAGTLDKIAAGSITQDMRALPGFSREDFISEVVAELIPHIRNFNPEMAAQNEKLNLTGWINGFVRRKADGVLGRKAATKEQFEDDVTVSEGAKQVADTEFDLEQDLKNEIDASYTTLLESKMFDDKVVKAITDKLKIQITTLNNSIYEAISKNKTVTPFVSELRKAIMKQADIDIRKAMGGIKDNQFRDFLLKNKKAILENMTTSFLSRFAPQTIEKQVNGEFVSDWQGKKIDRASAKETGMTSGPQIMRRKDNVENSITDEQWTDIFFKNDKIIAAKKESLSQQIAAEIGLDIFRNDLKVEGPLTEALNRNAEVRKFTLQDNYVAEIGRQLDRGNAKMNRVLKSRIADKYMNNGKQFIKDFNAIAAIIYKNNDTIDDFATDDVWNHKDLKKYPVEFIEHFRELEQKGAYAATGFKAAMFRNGVSKDIMDNYVFRKVDKDQVHKDNKTIAKSPIGRIIYNLYKNKNNDNISSEIAMLLYIRRFMDPAAKKRDGSQGAYHQQRNEIEQLLKDNNQTLPDEVSEALVDMRSYNSQKGVMFDIMKDIYSVSGKDAQLAKLAEYQDQIETINDANTVVLKFILKELRKLVQEGKIEINSALAVLQGQSNAALGIKSLTTWNYLTIDGKQRDVKELKAKGTRLYGEHLKVNVNTMGQLSYVITTAEDIDTDAWVDDNLNEYTQMASFADITGNLDNDLGKTNFTTSVDRINNLKQSDINNVYSTTGVKFRIHRSEQVAKNTANVELSKKNRSLNKARTFDKAVYEINKIDKTRKGITVLDFDDTVAISNSRVIVNMPNGTTKKITPAEFALESANLESQGATFDFVEFNKVVKGRKGPLFDLALKRQAKFGNKDIFILTARPQASARAIQQFAKGLGLNLKLENITGLENGTAQAKADWITGKVAEGYNDFYFADDAIKNVEAVQKVLDVADVKSDVQQAKMNKSLNTRFNDILEETKGIRSETRFSDAAAKARGAFKGRWNIIIEPSAEDFAGLLYQFMGKGRQGEQHKRFFEDNLIRPLARGINALNAAKQALRNDYEALKKKHKNVSNTLKKDSGYNNFTNDVAVRVYMWTKQGMKIPGLSKTDVKALVKIVNSNPEMKAYANDLVKITKLKEGWPAPQDDWLGSSIGLDIQEINQYLKREEYLQEFIDNKNVILSPENMNKIEAVYGSDFREALEDILYRIEKGTNRTFGNNRLVNRTMNWINSATGTIMFLNTRSAVLQTISFTNFVNYSDNNMLAAGAAFGNQKQFWKDFGFIFNSDFLKQRRGGMQQDVNWQEISDAVRGSRNPVRRAISLLLEKGFLPTQIADSFAIALGGASLYRNRTNTYIKQGMTKKEAEQKAFIDMQEVAETTQQSGRPDVISQEQASPLGRVLLAFNNVTMQYNRKSKKEFLDLLNNRRVYDPVTGEYNSLAKSRIIQMSRITYYMGMQNILFHSMQQALFAMLFDDDETDEKERQRYAGIANGMADSILRGMGIKGAVVATLKNMVLKFQKENEKPGGRADYAYVLIEGINVSPPLGSKARKTYSALTTYKFNKKEILEKSLLDPTSPIIESYANVISAATNVPTDRVYQKIESFDQILNSEAESWQRIALALGWRDWQLNIKDDDTTSGKQKDKSVKTTNKRKRLN